MNQSVSEIRVTAATPRLQMLQPAAIVLGGTALAAICAHISIPLWFTPVPLSLQPFAVLLLGLLLAPRMAAAVFLTYLVEGLAGLPVFAPSGAAGGLAHLLGPTGGYLMAYPIAAFLISWLWRRSPRTFGSALLSAAAGDVLILACGALWMTLLPVFGQHPAKLAVVPFLPGDVLKVAVAAAICVGWTRSRKQA